MGVIMHFTFKMIWFCYVLFSLTASASTDTITDGQSLNLSQTIVSSGQVFELGFFVPDGSNNIYVGIWYKVDRAAVVWVGNRDNPVTSPSANLTISRANLLIVGEGFSYLMSNVSTTRKTVAVLLDSGNLVLRGKDSISDILWQSFDYPTDTLLPQMKLGTDKLTGRVWSLATWKDSRDPSPGNFSLYLNTERPVEFVLMKGTRTYWSSGTFNGQIFPSVQETRLNSLNNYTFVNNDSIAYFTYWIYNASVLARFILDGTGTMNMMTWQDSDKGWNLIWSIPRDKCDLYSSCGPFSSCNSFSSIYCQCLEGFRPLDLASWQRQETSGGCVRRTPLLCDSNGTNTDKFSVVQDVILPLNPEMSSTISSVQCRDNCLNDCFCNAYAYDGTIGCSLWKEDLLNIRLLAGDDPNGGRLYLRLAASELQDNQGSKRLIKIISAVFAPVLLISFVIYIYFQRRNMLKGKKDAGEGITIFDAEVVSAAAHPDIRKQRSTNWFPQFTLSSIAAATDNFSLKYKLGEGGFGSVYKGVLRNGQEVAVKRLSSQSSQGLQELRNETMLMFKLQHKNLVRILGCCLDKGEKILVYEYMPNGSLDSFLFDPIKRDSVDWVTRAHIIKGIAQGLLYLHEYSRLRIIHRDLKASNVLLDKEMNPKISDFGLAKMFDGNISRAKTNHVAGTYGYMSPEYALGGVVSIKSDVFSFGVLLLEVISGKKNAGFYQTGSLNLLSYAWELWIGDKALQLVDPALGQEFDSVAVMRYMKVGLLCVEEIAGDRPTMSEVVPMLTNDNAALPSPKQPAFTNCRPARMPDQPIPPTELCSKNDMTVSSVVGR